MYTYMKILRTNREKNVYRVEENADGTLCLLSENRKHEVENAGQIIASSGGIDRVKSLCVEYTQEELDKERCVKSDGKRVLHLLNSAYFCFWPDKPVLINGQQVHKVATGNKCIIPNYYLYL